MVQIYLAKTLIVYVIGYTLGELLAAAAAVTDSPAKKKTLYILAVAITMNAIIEIIRL